MKLLALLCGTVGAMALSAQVVEIPDPGLEAAVRQTLAKPTGDLTKADLATLTELAASDRAIRSCSGLEWATNLTRLELSRNELEDLTFPTGLERLRVLWLGGNRLTNISLPNDLVKLETLALWGNRLSRLTLPANLISLRHLSVAENRLTDFPALGELGTLITLDLSDNALTNFTAPIGLSRLGQLNLSRNVLREVRLAGDLGSLEELDLTLNALVELQLPNELPKLRMLNLQHNRLSTFRIPVGVTNIAWVNLWRNNLEAFEASDLVKLETLIISAHVRLAPTATALQTRGVEVFYPEPVVGISRAVEPPGHRLLVYGDQPATYVVLRSSDLLEWTEAGQVAITLAGFEGAGVFTDPSAVPLERAFYRVKLN